VVGWCGRRRRVGSDGEGDGVVGGTFARVRASAGRWRRASLDDRCSCKTLVAARGAVVSVEVCLLGERGTDGVAHWRYWCVACWGPSLWPSGGRFRVYDVSFFVSLSSLSFLVTWNSLLHVNPCSFHLRVPTVTVSADVVAVVVVSLRPTPEPGQLPLACPAAHEFVLCSACGVHGPYVGLLGQSGG